MTPRGLRYCGFLALGTAFCAAAVIAQQAPAPAPGARAGMPGGIPPAVLAEMQRAEAAYRAMPDMPGTGRYPAVKREDPTLPAHTIYEPADLTALGRARLPIVVWGNGGCAGDGAGQRLHLLEIASHGYLVIANGPIGGPGATEARRPPMPPAAAGTVTPPPPQTSAEQLTQAIDWAVAENARKGSRLHGRIDPAAIAVSGWSCGGVQALTIATSDPRVKTAVIHNSGLLPPGGMRLPGMALGKEALARLRAPVVYILGGPTDIAYANGMDDYARIASVPVAVASLPVGHIGTFMQANGGKAAQVAAHWLDWRLKGDQAAARWFAGADCTLCRASDWTYQRKGF